MRLKTFGYLGFATVLLAGPVMAQTAPSADDVDATCAATACRQGGYSVAIRVDDKHYTTIPVTRSPYVLDDGTLLIFPGETLAFQVTLDGDKVTNVAFYKAFAPSFPASIAKDDGLSDNAGDAALPSLTGKDTKEKMAGLPANIVLLSYGQSDDIPGMLLVMEHNLPGTLKVDAVMAAVVSGKTSYDVQPTSTCPIMEHIAGFEMWPNPIGPMMIKNLRLLPAGAEMTCT
ncbi:MAG: hypothetical protein JF615_08990 [Asticcacaulis sp.]|nr:hypothetical protein [Asticcacaulis sp.]